MAHGMNMANAIDPGCTRLMSCASSQPFLVEVLVNLINCVSIRQQVLVSERGIRGEVGSV